MAGSDIIRREQALACLRARMLGLVGCLGLLLVAVTVWGLLAVNSANSREEVVLHSASDLLHGVDEVRQGQVSFKRQVQEWKDTLLRGGNRTDFDRYWTAFEADEKATDTDLAQARTLLAGQQMPTAPIDEFLTSHAQLATAYREAIKAYNSDDATTIFAVDRKVRGIDRQPTSLLDNYVQTLVAASKTRFSNLDAHSEQQVDFDKKFREAMLLTVTIGIALAVVFSVRSLARVEEILEGGDEAPPG